MLSDKKKENWISIIKSSNEKKLMAAICIRLATLSNANSTLLWKNFDNFRNFKEIVQHTYSKSVVLKEQIDEAFSIDNKRIRQRAQTISKIHYEFQRDTKECLPDQIFWLIGTPSVNVKNIERWFYINLLRHERQVTAYFYKIIGVVRANEQEIIPNSVLASRKNQLASQEKYLENAYLTSTDASGVETKIPMKDICKTKERMSSKTYAQLKGLEFLSKHLGLLSIFITLTLPPDFHPSPKNNNNTWDGFTPEQGHDFLQGNWRSIQKIMNKNGGRFFGVRVEEPHLDGCPHWHILVFIEPSRYQKLEATIRKFFIGEKSAKIDILDDSKSSASSYVMKYIKPFYFDRELEENDMKTNKGTQRRSRSEKKKDFENLNKKQKMVSSYDAHRATWGFRSIQILDLPGAATIWDHLRLLKNNEKNQKNLSLDGEKLFDFAINNNYGEFLLLLLKMNKHEKRAGIFYTTDENGKKSQAKGLIIDGEVLITKSKQWKIKNS